jgi:hypothetical protein
MKELQIRFESVARGRAVNMIEKQSTLLNNDFEVAYENSSDSYLVQFTRNGWFEEAYSFIQRWIKKHAEKLDGVYKPPDQGKLDCTVWPMYWMTERLFNTYLADLQSAIEKQIAWLEKERPNEGVSGEYTIESRTESLYGASKYLRSISDEVRSAVLSPSSLEFLKVTGIDLLSFYKKE